MPLYLTSHMDQSDPSTAMNTSMPNNINYHRCATPNDARVFLSGKLMWLLLAIINHSSQQSMLWLVVQDESLQVHLTTVHSMITQKNTCRYMSTCIGAA